MVAWVPVMRTALKVAPFAIEIARQVDRQLRPHVLAYRKAKEVDGYVASWTADDGSHWIVFPRRNAAPLQAFPPLPVGELELVARELDRSTLRHHSDLPEAKVRGRGSRFVDGPIRVISKRRDDPDQDPPAPSPSARLSPPDAPRLGPPPPPRR